MDHPDFVPEIVARVITCILSDKIVFIINPYLNLSIGIQSCGGVVHMGTRDGMAVTMKLYRKNQYLFTESVG